LTSGEWNPQNENTVFCDRAKTKCVNIDTRISVYNTAKGEDFLSRFSHVTITLHAEKITNYGLFPPRMEQEEHEGKLVSIP